MGKSGKSELTLSVHCFHCCAEAFQFDGSYHLALFLWLVLLVSSSKPSLWRPMPKNFSPMLSFRSFVVSGVLWFQEFCDFCKPLIYLALNFVYGIRDLTCSTRDGTCAPGMKTWNLNHWIVREIPIVTANLSVSLIIPVSFL